MTENTFVYESKPIDFSPDVEVVATYVEVNGKLLFLKLSQSKQEAGAWGVPAGKLEADEIALMGAKRELFEETGIIITPKDLFRSLGQLYIRKPGIDYLYRLFAVKLDESPHIKLSEEHQNYQWVTPGEAEGLNLMNGARQALDFYYRQREKY